MPDRVARTKWTCPAAFTWACVLGCSLFVASCLGREPGLLDDTSGPIPTEPGDYGRSMQSDGRERVFGMHIPEGFSTDEPTPAYFVFHGGGPKSNGENLAAVRDWGFEDRAGTDGGVVVYPLAGHSGEDNQIWNDGRDTTGGADDLAFVADLLERLDERLNLDRDRIYATGASNGGMMSFHIACNLSEEFAAVAPVIAALPRVQSTTCSPTEPVSLLAIQGSEDECIDFCGGDATCDVIGGRGGAILSAGETRRFWANANDCSSDPDLRRLEQRTRVDATRAYRWEHRLCTDATRIDYYYVDGMGHRWPPSPAALNGSRELDATARIWSFFQGVTDQDPATTLDELPDPLQCE